MCIAEVEFKRENYGNAMRNLHEAVELFNSLLEKENQKYAKKLIGGFLIRLIENGNVEALEKSLEVVLKIGGELKELIEPIFIAIEIVKSKDLSKYYDLQIEKREVVVEIVRKLTGSDELIPEEFRSHMAKLNQRD
ncbi:MAG: hypothetical protein NZ872_02035 [Archaeoglobaceae archaeon]|nr:hypothetical protein [Archaeoglobaceae archaeon]MDW8127978.1 hypothetical protein [Archaeoglobaceae archaeon]